MTTLVERLADAMGYDDMNEPLYREAKARIEALEAKVAIAATIFEEYERLHRAKGTLEGDAKAYRNAQYADEMRAALAGNIKEG